jgi:hypothetical protein
MKSLIFYAFAWKRMVPLIILRNIYDFDTSTFLSKSKEASFSSSEIYVIGEIEVQVNLKFSREKLKFKFFLQKYLKLFYKKNLNFSFFYTIYIVNVQHVLTRRYFTIFRLKNERCISTNVHWNRTNKTFLVSLIFSKWKEYLLSFIYEWRIFKLLQLSILYL